jgi:hypothetical protein
MKRRRSSLESGSSTGQGSGKHRRSGVELGAQIRRIDHRHDLVLFYGVADIDQPLRNVGSTALGRDV